MKKKYGKLTILKELKTKKYRMFRCQCDCGRIEIKTYPQLTSPAVPQCKECAKPPVKDRTIHICGKPIAQHKRCKLCGIVLCSETEKSYNGYCKDCSLINKKKPDSV